MSAYELVTLAKERQNIDSDNALAIAIGVSRAHVYNWKRGLNKPDGIAILRLQIMAGVTAEKALELVLDTPVQNELELREAGFANVHMLAGIASLSLIGVGALAGIPTLAGLVVASSAFIHYAK